MQTWRDIKPELSLGFYLVAWVVALGWAYAYMR